MSARRSCATGFGTYRGNRAVPGNLTKHPDSFKIAGEPRKKVMSTVLMYRKTVMLVALFVLAIGSGVSAQEQQVDLLLPAAQFFDRMAEEYGRIQDYVAEVTINSEGREMRGTLYYAEPDKIRIDFREPEGQILVSDGEMLKIHIPQFNVTLQQELRGRQTVGGTEGMAGLASERGLNLLRRNYSIAYQQSPAPVPLDENSSEMVVNLRLNWRSPNEGYRQLVLSVDENYRIRRIVGVTANYREIEFDFRNVRVNDNIPASRFDYEPPSSANRYHNFLFDREG